MQPVHNWLRESPTAGSMMLGMLLATTTFRSFVIIGFAAAGCGDDGGATGSFDVDKLLRACTIVHSCLAGYDISTCVFDFNRKGTPAQVDCVLAASVADCDAANA